MASKAMFGENLRAKAARGGAWLGGGSAAEQVTRFARNMLLTRLLAPGAFGAMAIVLSTSALVGSLSDVWIGPAVIQNPRGGEDSYLNAAWWMGFARAVCIYVMVFGAAPWIAHFYGIANLSILLRVTMFGTILDGMISPRAKLAQKEMKFRRFAAFSNGGAICGVIGLHPIDRLHDSTSVGYWIDAGHQGRGIVTAACRAWTVPQHLAGLR